MSGNHPDHSSPSRSPYRTADELIRSILDDNASATDISPSGELYRLVERYHSNRRPTGSARRELVGNHLSRWASRSSSRNDMPSESNSETQRRFSREPQTSDSSPLYNLPPSLPPLRSLSNRRPSVVSNSNASTGRQNRVRLSDRLSGSIRHRNIQENRAEINNDTTPISWTRSGAVDQNMADGRRRSFPAIAASWEEDDDMTRLRDDIGPQTNTLLNFVHPSTNPNSERSFPSAPLHGQEAGEDSRRVKRRKLDADCLSTGFQGFRYGRFGQVEPGHLTMELVSCDGGIYSDDGHKYAAENVLKNDQTVYCTQGPRCNIVLRHQGATVFTLKELIIKAPRSNFTSPVQEGMVFVSMTSDHLLTRTAQYQIRYSPSSSSSRRTERETQPLAPIVSIRHNEDGSTMTRAQVRARRLYDIRMEDEDNEVHVAQIPSEFNVSPPPFIVTTECSDDDSDDLTARADWRAPNRIGSLPFESESSDEDGNLDDFLGTADYRSPRRRNRSSTTLAEAAEAAQIATQEAVRAVGGELLAPHARFFIERHKSKCRIKFDPPVSGRFILLKMWSPHRSPDANIDIQAVMAYGYAGPRYFPSVELQ